MHPNISRVGGIFEGFAVEVADGGAKARVSKMLGQGLGPGWTIRRFGDRKSDFELRVVGGELSERDAWNATYALRDLPGVVYAEPMFATSVSDKPEWSREANVPPDAPAPDEDGLRTKALVEALSSLLGTSVHELAGELSRIGQELAFLFATDPKGYVSFRHIIENQLRSQELVALRQHLAARASTSHANSLECRPQNSRGSPETTASSQSGGR
jgi:hypothetical protein